jgi:hypothetical protein
VKIRADVEVKCFSYQGIEAIRKALLAGEALSSEEVPIKIRLVAPPLYVISTTSTDKALALERMESCVETIGERIKEEGGDMVVKMNVSEILAAVCLLNECFLLVGAGMEVEMEKNGDLIQWNTRRPAAGFFQSVHPSISAQLRKHGRRQARRRYKVTHLCLPMLFCQI